MSITLIRTILIYFIALFVIRMMGKAELSKMSPFQMVIVFMIAELATIPIESPDVSMITGVAAIFTLMFLQVLISLISLKCEKFKNFLSGKPSILIDKGEINHNELKKLRITINDLMEQLRLCSAASISEVEYAIMESNGDLSIIQKSNCKPLTPKDMDIAKNPEMMPAVLISDGVLYHNNIAKTGWNESSLKDWLSAHGIAHYEDVFLAFCDGDSSIHVYMTDSVGDYAKEVTK